MNSNNDVDMARGDDHVLGGEGRGARRRRRIAGCSRARAATATSTRSSPTAGRSPRRRPSRSAAGWRWSWPALTIDDVERRRPVLVLPVGRAARRAEPRAGARPPADPHRRPAVRRRPVEQLRDARHRHRDGRPARPARAPTGWCGPTAATRRSTRSASTRTSRRRSRFQHAYPQDEIDAMPQPRAGRADRRRRAGDDRGVHGDALARGRPGDRDRRLPAGRRPPGLGHVERRCAGRTRCATANGSAKPAELSPDGTLTA